VTKENKLQAVTDTNTRNRDLRITNLAPLVYSRIKVLSCPSPALSISGDQATRLARQVADSEVRRKLLEMAGEYSRYAELMEARESEVF